MNMAALIARSLRDLSKLDPLDGTNYKRWSYKLLIFFEALEVDSILFDEPTFEDSESAGTTSRDLVAQALALKTKAENMEKKKKFEKDNKTVRGHLLNHMTNTSFNLFVNDKSAKTIWEKLENEYGGDDVGKKKCVV